MQHRSREARRSAAHRRGGLAIAVASALGIAACSGGGSSSTPADETTSHVTLAGVVSKGPMTGAKVEVFAVGSDGRATGSALASFTTVASAPGAYSLSFDAPVNQPYVVQVSAPDAAGTTHLDEASGTAQALPAGFTMRAIVLPTSAGNVSTTLSVTPFTEMAVAAAAKADGGLTVANTHQASRAVRELLGFDPAATRATSVGAASNGDEQRLAVLLTAVSVMARDGALGCTSAGSGGDRTRCVVDALAASATATSMKLTTADGTDTSAALRGAVQTVLDDSSLSGSVGSTELATALTNLACTTNCAVSTTPEPTPADPTAVAITAAKGLVNDLRTTWQSLLSSDGLSATATGSFNREAWRFQQAMTGAKVPAEALAKDLGAMFTAVDLYNDYMSGRTTIPSRGHGDGDSLVSNSGNADFSGISAVGCTLYSDTGNTVVATAPANVVSIGCSARFYLSATWDFSVTPAVLYQRQYRHGLRLLPQADGSFNWNATARLREQACPGGSGCAATSADNTAVSLDSTGTAITNLSGVFRPTLDGTWGSVTAFTASGQLPAMFTPGQSSIVAAQHHLLIEASGTVATAANGVQTQAFSATLKPVAQDGSTVLATLSLLPGTQIRATPVTRDASGRTTVVTSPAAGTVYDRNVSYLKLDIAYANASAELQATLLADSFVYDSTGTETVPSALSFTGRLATTTAGVSTSIFTGTLSLGVSGYGSFNATLDPSPTNFHDAQASLTGTLTAPSRPAVELVLAASGRVDNAHGSDTTLRAATARYRTLVDGAPRLVIDLTGEVDSSGNVTQATLAESSSSLQMVLSPAATTSNLQLRNGTTLTTIGSYTRGGSMLNFTDGSFVSLDMGL